MTEVKIIAGKLTVNKTTTGKSGKPAKFPFPVTQYDSLLQIAKKAGIATGTSRASQTKAVNLVVKAALDDFIASQSKPKAEK
jgi:hypothetical protein